MSVLAGSEAFTRDLALGLLRSGHRPSVYSPRLGIVSDELKQAGIPVFDRLSDVPQAPDVIHGNQHAELVAAIAHFRDVPAVFTCHSPVSLFSIPPFLQRVRHFAAVDIVRRDRLAREKWIPSSDISIVCNSIDPERFPPRPLPLPAKPRRALLFGNNASDSNFGGQVKAVCARAGLHLELAGSAAGRVEVDAASRLAQVDLVFAVGRSAMEAMATGTGCILCDRDGMGPLVTPANVALLRDYNFGRAAATGEISVTALCEQLERYDPADISKVQHWVRQEMSLEKVVAQYESIYRTVIQDPRPLPDLSDDFRRYAEHLGTMIHELISQSPAADDRFNPESHVRQAAALIRDRLSTAAKERA